uniref:uncharacterized protein LOC101307481 isoform X2 n=1 Tax=Fragaria vesca subsp. vesca TaxID=101020 RepID=UPI0005C9FFFD|nr:PREDICTED: uncharacterized protein LOC101307481 isoform X2 [Fragaria vesca subsp. vesca]
MAASDAISQSDVKKLALSFETLDASSPGPYTPVLFGSKFREPVAGGDASMNKGPLSDNEGSKVNSKQTVICTPVDCSSNFRGPVAGGVASTDEGPCLRCDVCSKEHPLCDICYKVHHYELCPYFHRVPQGATFDPGYEIICGCGNIFNEDKWACTFCGGSIAMLKAKYCDICRSWKLHSTYECLKDEVRAAMYKSDRDKQLSLVRKWIPYVSKSSSGKLCVPTIPGFVDT